MAYIRPSVTDFKAYFTRDFPYGSTSSTVMDSDIIKAMGEADFNFNEGLFSSQENFNIGYLLLTAHYLVIDLRNSSQGIAGQFEWLASSKSVGSVSEGFSIPQRILDNPTLALLTKTNYGAKFLALVLPLLTGQIFISCGGTTP